MLMLLLLCPIAIPFISKMLFKKTITWPELAANVVIVSSIVIGIYYMGMYNQTADTEVWNGQITKKQRIHDDYVRSYDCNCYTTCSGSGSSRSCSESCSTCYEDHYTVEWLARTTAGGSIRFDYRDSTSRSVYKLPDPNSYLNCVIGEPASLEHPYTNYVMAVPQSIFNTDATNDFLGKIPSYPRVHSLYKINRVLDIDSGISQEHKTELNSLLSSSLIILGKHKQVNIITILTNITDPSYRYAVENSWKGGKKNDVVVFIGVDADKNIIWTDVMTWALNSGNELFHVKLRDGLKQTVFTPTTIAETITSNMTNHYDRPLMKDYEYLKSEIKPPTWTIVSGLIVGIVLSLLLSLLFHLYDFGGGNIRRRRFR